MIKEKLGQVAFAFLVLPFAIAGAVVLRTYAEVHELKKRWMP